ncbi:MAG: hypothetical protein M1816_005874 [Peltula sp. TS41687]|nr:MAG: hypothetical protein M1816_005874 [Peltula sp. TS41687]
MRLEERSEQMENFLVDALVRAGQCKGLAIPFDRATWQAPSKLPGFPSRLQRRVKAPTVSIRPYHATSTRCQREATKEDYLHLVDHYAEIPTDDDSRKSNPLPSASLLSAQAEQQRRRERSPRDSPLLPEDESVRATLRNLKDALDAPDHPQETVYDFYRALPAPRLEYLSANTIRLLMRRLSVVEHRSVPTMMRYLSVVDDLKRAGIPLTTAEWNSWISFAGRCLFRISGVEVASALQVFRKMELEAGVRADHVTFNILFDLAAKAGKFGLAEIMLQEMRARGLEPNRFGGVALIYYNGLKGDGDGVRAAYRRLLDDGHIVDTVVLNCVIAALIKSGETPAAEQVYERMKMFASRKGVPLPPRYWRDIRHLGKALQRKANQARGDVARRRKLQDDAILTPDLRTYRILVSHHSVETGQLEYVSRLLHEMRWYAVQLHASIFISLLRGFSVHGGIRYATWSISLLENVWTACLDAADNRVDEIYLGKWLVIWVLRAYGKCAGKERMLEVWEDIKERWTPTEDELDAVKKAIRVEMKLRDARY